MNKQFYNPAIHHRRSIRLKGYDYSLPDLFFITICVQNKTCLFGEIINQQMILNDAGVMVEKWYVELENKFPDIKCYEHVVMPNHFHCIIENVGAVGADLCVRPNAAEADLCVRPDKKRHAEKGGHTKKGGHAEKGGHIGPPLRIPVLDDHRGSSSVHPPWHFGN